MRVLSFICYFFAGALLKNSTPHFIVALTGRRNMTPFGRDSSPSVNLIWSWINAIAAALLMGYADKREHADADSKMWQVPYEAGCLFWSLFGVLYAWFTEGQKFRRS